MFKTLAVVAACVVFLAGLCFGQQGRRSESTTTPTASTTCAYNFSANSGAAIISFCVTVNGNILNLKTGTGVWLQDGQEGYGICNESPAQAYYDYAINDSGNLGAPSLLSSTTTSVKIARTTADGNWTLTQTITVDKVTPAAKVLMQLKNNTSVGRRAYLLRYGYVYWDRFGSARNSAFTWSPAPDATTPGAGVELANIGGGWTYTNGLTLFSSFLPNPCDFAGYWSSSTFPDGGLEVVYVDTVKAGATRTATLVYRAM